MAHEEPYKHLEDFSQVGEISHYPKISIDIVKMWLFPFTPKDKAKDWLQALAQELNSWSDMEAAFLKKIYSVQKTNSIWTIRDFVQSPQESFYEAWERVKDYMR